MPVACHSRWQGVCQLQSNSSIIKREPIETVMMVVSLGELALQQIQSQEVSLIHTKKIKTST